MILPRRSLFPSPRHLYPRDPLVLPRINIRASMASMTSDLKEVEVMDASELKDGEKWVLLLAIGH